MHQLCLPVLKAKRPVWDTFPGAWYTIGIDAIMPNGRTLQVASCHHYRDQWAKAFDITYETKDATQAHVHQTTYGMSERLLGAVVGMHGDDSGLIMPPAIAPIQVVICPWCARTPPWTRWRCLTRWPNACVTLDSASRWTTGICTPVRSTTIGRSRASRCGLKLDPRDVEQGSVFAARRTGGKAPISMDELESGVRTTLDEIAEELRTRAYAHVDDVVKPLPAWGEDGLESPVEEGRIYELAFNGSDADAERLERATGMGFLGDATEALRRTASMPCHG